MTEAEFLSQYGDVEARLDHYYKYSFIYIHDDIRVVTLGVTDYMYRATFKPKMKIREIVEQVPVRAFRGAEEIWENFDAAGYGMA